MADIKQDLLSLQYSQSFTIQGTQEENIDLQLPPAPPASATISGVVTDGTTPISNATVKLFDSTGMPYQHTLTDSTGAFTLTDIPAGTYSLAAVADGYQLSDAAGVTLTDGTTINVNLVCAPDATAALGAIAGILTVNTPQGATPLGGAKITLQNTSGDTLAITYTANDGEFVFYDLADGTYQLLSAADGYLPSTSMTAVVTGGAIVNLTMSMVVDVRTYSGTVSGTILDSAGQPVSGCFVGLYQTTTVGGVTQEHLVAVTKTNAAGNYLFGGVVGGNYLVKAKLEQ